MKAFRAGHVQAREKGDPLDAAAIKAFMITAMNHDTNPVTAGNQASFAAGAVALRAEAPNP